MSKFTVSKARYDDGEVIEATYVYRGIEFYRRDNVLPGYFGRYEIKIPKSVVGLPRDASSQTAVKNIIDRYLEMKG